jgi:hypothetical protein
MTSDYCVPQWREQFLRPVSHVEPFSRKQCRQMIQRMVRLFSYHVLVTHAEMAQTGGGLVEDGGVRR